MLIKRKGLFLLSSILLAFLIILGLALCFPNITTKTPSALYEEIYSVSSEFDDKIGEIDKAVYGALFQMGIEEKDVFFLKVIPSHERGYEWDYTELLINLPDRGHAVDLQKIIDVGLSELGPSVTFETGMTSDSEIIYRIYVLGFFVHKIELRCGERLKIGRKAVPKVAIIIDDIGYDTDLAVSFMDLDIPLSLSVLPWGPCTEEIVNIANSRRSELLLHLPMQPKNYPDLDPGPGALLVDMDEHRIRRIIGEDIKQVPGLRGVNNHMGSCFTERIDKMRIVLEEVKERDLFYVDSRTTTRTVAFDLAKDMGVPVAKKSIFLDNDVSSAAIKVEMEKLLGIARSSGEAVGIAHPHKETVKVLKDYTHKLKTEFKVVPVSELAE
jgi:polysaccharide deacetylase 2 family uncharacterized protein YibQ